MKRFEVKPQLSFTAIAMSCSDPEIAFGRLDRAVPEQDRIEHHLTELEMCGRQGSQREGFSRVRLRLPCVGYLQNCPVRRPLFHKTNMHQRVRALLEGTLLSKAKMNAVSNLAWWAHQDLNLEPTDYELPVNSVNATKQKVVLRNWA